MSWTNSNRASHYTIPDCIDLAWATYAEVSMNVRTILRLSIGFGWSIELIVLKVFGTNTLPSHWLIGIHKRRKYVA